MSTYNKLKKHFELSVNHSKLLNYHENKFLELLQSKFNIHVDLKENYDIEDLIVDAIHMQKDSEAFYEIMELVKKRL